MHAMLACESTIIHFHNSPLPDFRYLLPMPMFAHIRRPLLMLAALLFCVPAAMRGQEESALAGITAIFTPAAALAPIKYLADDRLMGRNTPSPELDTAAEYLASELASYGVQPVNGSYFQSFRVRRDDLGSPTTLSIASRTLDIRTDFIPFEFTSDGAATGELVFVGFGISRPDFGYDDYSRVDVRGKVVLAVMGGPRGFTNGDVSGQDLDPGTREKMRWAEEHGAVGFMLCANPLTSILNRPIGYPWPSLYGALGHGPPIQLDLPSTFRSIPSVSVGKRVIELGMGLDVEHFAERVRRIDASGEPASMSTGRLIGIRVSLTTHFDTVHNVVGIIPGREIPDEVVVIGAHYDHVGHYQSLRQRDDANADTIFNGADDNASGCAAVLMNARAFASLRLAQRPRRSIVVVFFAGEEKGLFGSRMWVSQEPIPIARTVAMINLDMIGRNHRDSILVGGVSRSSDIGDIVREANASEGMSLGQEPEQLFYRRDQASFAARRVPILSFSSGFHADYHKVSDESDKIDLVKVARVARLCFNSARLAAETTSRPVYDGPEAPAWLVVAHDDNDHDHGD